MTAPAILIFKSRSAQRNYSAFNLFATQGLDVACDVIANNTNKFAAQAEFMSFECIDMTSEQMPTGYDLIFSRDALQHLPLSSTRGFLSIVKASRYVS